MADLWTLAQSRKDQLAFSTLFTAQNVRDHLSSDEGIDKAVAWCKATAVTRVFIETFRNGYTAERTTLERARDRLSASGIDVAGCVTTTRMGKYANGTDLVSCYTDSGTLAELNRIFEYTASLFDLIMIDDFLFTTCECEDCEQSRGDRSWSDYRADLMVDASRNQILGAARAVNSGVRIINKYPLWYDHFHLRGYEVVRQTADYDLIWVGTETRDFDDKKWGGKAQYGAYYIMRWLGEIGGEKTGGGWFDPYGTTPLTYVEQARQTVLGGAREAVLFCYGALLQDTGPGNVARLRNEIPDLYALADIVRNRETHGISAPKPPNSDPGEERYVFDFLGMLGLPLVPTSHIDTYVPAAFLSHHALGDPDLRDKLRRMLDAGTPLLITDGLARELPEVDLTGPNVQILEVDGNPRGLLDIPTETLERIRSLMLEPFDFSFDAPARVSIYLIGDNHIVVENFNDEPALVRIDAGGLAAVRIVLQIPSDLPATIDIADSSLSAAIPARSLLVLEEPS